MKLQTDLPESVPYLDLPAQMRAIRKDIDAAIARTLDNCSFCLGPDVAQFEKDFARFCGAEHCVAFNSGTSALHIAMRLLNVGPGDEVITTPCTFVATSWAISYVGAKPVYVDVDDATFNLDPKLVERAITPRTKAVHARPSLRPSVRCGPDSGDLPQAQSPARRRRRPGARGEIPRQDRRHLRCDVLLQLLSGQESRRLRRRRRAGDE